VPERFNREGTGRQVQLEPVPEMLDHA